MANLIEKCKNNKKLWKEIKKEILDARCPKEFGMKGFSHSKCRFPTTNCDECWQDALDKCVNEESVKKEEVKQNEQQQ